MKFLSLLAAALMAGCATVPATAPVMQQSAAASLEAEGTYKLEDVLGIGPKYAEALRGAGVTTIAKLLAAAQTREERKELARETGIPYGNVLHIARKVQLMEIHGVGVRLSNLLEAVGVDGVKELAHRVPANLHERLVFANHISRPFVKQDPSLSMVTRWVNEAKEMVSTGKAIEE
jgi:predicted flap endonuclease-1-like 5' DNA nuclease